MSAFSSMIQNQLGYKLSPISLRQLLYMEKTPVDLYGLEDGLFHLFFNKGNEVNRKMIKDLLSKGHVKLFVQHNERQSLVEKQQENLRNITRSLSIGDPIEKGKLIMNLMTIHMEFLYQNPTDDEALHLQYQSARNFSSFLINDLSIHQNLYREYMKQKHHFIFAQPMISSLFLIGSLKISKLFSEKEMESLFVTSYFKDIGMSAIPTEKYDEKQLSDDDKVLLSNHAKHSVEILSGRISLTPNHLKIIENHHAFSLLKKELNQETAIETSDQEGESTLLSGTETIMVCAMDIIAAMITGRPFRERTKLFDALDLVRLLISDDYPQEFRVMVNYFKQFKQGEG